MIQIYHNIQTSLPVKREGTYAVKSRSELKQVYDKIVSLSKRSPFYKITISQESKDYTLGIKEAALNLKANLYNMQNPQISNFHTNAVSVNDDSILSAYLLQEDCDNIPREIEIKVNQLATVQENKGKELMDESHALPRGTYLFECEFMDEKHSLVYAHEDRRANVEVMKQLTDYLNQSMPGIEAFVESALTPNYSFIRMVSQVTGRKGENTFTMKDSEIHDQGIVEFFGLNRIEKQAMNAQFELNGVDKQTTTNAFILENTISINLKAKNEHPTTLRITPDSEKVLKSVEKVLFDYNKLINLAQTRSHNNKENYNASKLLREMKNLQSMFSEELSTNGINLMSDGTLEMEYPLAVQASMDGGMEELFTRENGFIARLKEKTEAIAINPMDYLEKIVVLYPNTQKNNVTNPYVTSMYSGLFYNSYG